MTATLDRDQIRARIDALECLSNVQTAIDDVGAVRWEPGERGTFDVQITASGDDLGISFVNNIPPSVLLAGLQAMERELAMLAGLREPA